MMRANSVDRLAAPAASTLAALAVAFGVAATLPACDRPSSSSNATPPAVETPSPSGAPETPKAPPVAPPAASTSAGPETGASLAAGFDDEPLGGAPAAFEPVVGDWRIAEAGGATGLEVDGSKWRDGTPSTSLADQAKRLYGDRYAEFLDGVKAFAFYPLAVFREPPPAGDLRITVRFYAIAGKIDQGAGIAWGIAPDGSYHGVRANPLEDNLLYFKVVRGKRTIMKVVRNVTTPTRAWHTLAIEIRDRHLVVNLDEKKRLEKEVEAAPAGRVGLWSKADSQVLFDDFEVRAL
jgi:hypothetical protein